MEGVELHFEQSAVDAVVDLALQRGTGARALRSIIGEVMLDIMFGLPERPNVTECTITKDVILKKRDPLYRYEERKQSA
jgi:ATP-dependent Clp protease ATP-binding subunit ClpX